MHEVPVKEELLRAAKVLADTNCLPATDGNFSARLDNHGILLTRAGVEKRTLSDEGLIIVKLEDVSPAGASSEWPMHKAIYLSRPDVNCILHVHAPGLTTFAAAHKTPNTALLAEAVMTIGEIALVPFTKPGGDQMGERLLKTSSTASVYLLSNHGALSVGGTVAEALHRLERAEFLARIELSAQSIGGAIPLQQKDLEELNR
jgi:L-fuculose-phosphate aldolase